MTKHTLRYGREEFEEKVQDFLRTFFLAPQKFETFYLAFVHKSVLNEATSGYIESNERLEFLGDAVLELVITERLFLDFPEKPEGELTDIRSALVRGRNLAGIAKDLGISEMIQLSRGEVRVSGYGNPYILANVIEAIIGAIYQEFGLEGAKKWILEHIYYKTIDAILSQDLYVDPKSYLQELTQEVWGVLPKYDLYAEEGQDHNKLYFIRVVLGDVILGEGKGTSKKKGEQDAAENAILQRKDWEEKISLPKKNS